MLSGYGQNRKTSIYNRKAEFRKKKIGLRQKNAKGTAAIYPKQEKI